MSVLKAIVAAAAVAVLAGCGGPGQTGASPAPSAPTPSPSSTSGETPTSKDTPTAVQPTRDEVRLTLTSQGSVITPNAEKVDAPVGATVILSVSSDIDDEIHAHTGGDGYELEVTAGTPATGRFTVDQPGSFEIESHRLEKVFVILNVR